MKPEIKKIRLSELEDFVKSKRFSEMEVVPVTPARVNSYLANPHAKTNDVVLYLGYINDELVCFRSLFAGSVKTGGKTVRFGWCSGNWVHQEFRRRGFSELLLKEAYADWEKRLMFTNYAPASEKLYLKTGWFNVLHQFSGIRAYLFPKTKKLKQGATKNWVKNLVLVLLDGIIYMVSCVRVLFYSKKMNKDMTFTTLPQPDEDCAVFLQNSEEQSLWERRWKELEWIFNYPWLSEINAEFISQYPFSSYDQKFYYKVVKVYQKEQFSGFFIFSVRDGHLKTLFFKLKSDLSCEIADYLKSYCAERKIELLTVYNSPVANEFFKRKYPFLKIKKYGQKIYCSFAVEDNSSFRFQDGDGDVFFT